MRVGCDLLDTLPDDLEDAAGVLSAVQYLLTSKIRSIGEMDEYARKRLLKKVREASSCLGEVPFSGRRVLSWMEEQVATAVVEGEGPRPGRIFVAPLHSGGHSGRTHVFVVGLDDGRFPGAAFQDPLLLDSERKRLSAELPTSSMLTEIKMESFTMLMSRLRASVTLSYSCRDLAEDREMFPSPIMVSAFRITSGKRDATLEDLLAYLPPPASFAPASERGCLSMSEWWLYRLCERGPVPDAEQTVAATFPHLGRGMDAMRARESDGFTVYDGYVPEAGRDLDPTRPGGPVLSSQRLELLGRCPLEYFFTYILGISPPEEFLYDSQVWLNAMETGGLLHRVFNTFYRRIHELGELPDFQRHWPLLQEILESEIESSRSLKPPPNPQAFAETRARLRLTARIFLREEEANREARMPLYFEVAVGTEKEGGNPVDLADPVTVTLPGGRQVRVRGTIDRIDALPGDGRERFVICDYKTGSAGSYNERDPFRGGRCVQNYLYLVLARSCLPQRHRDAEVTSFEYYFPGVRGHGERISWEASRLDGGLEILDNLVGMLSLGCFPCSDSHDDMKYSDFKPAFLDVKKSAEQLQAKLANHENDALAPFRRLRMPGEVGS
jgi:ATP-dependent helicase/nuclease subunit B